MLQCSNNYSFALVPPLVKGLTKRIYRRWPNRGRPLRSAISTRHMRNRGAHLL